MLSDLLFSENESAFNSKIYIFSPEEFDQKMELWKKLTNLSIHYSDILVKKYNYEIYDEFSIIFWRRIYFTSLYEIITTIDRYQKSIENILINHPKSLFEVQIFKNASFNEIVKEIWNKF